MQGPILPWISWIGQLYIWGCEYYPWRCFWKLLLRSSAFILLFVNSCQNLFWQEYPGLVRYTFEDFLADSSRFTMLQHVLGSALRMRLTFLFWWFDEFGLVLIRSCLWFCSTNVKAIRVVERCMENASPLEKALFLKEVIPNLRLLASHPFGNFVLQRVYLTN